MTYLIYADFAKRENTHKLFKSRKEDYERVCKVIEEKIKRGKR